MNLESYIQQHIFPDLKKGRPGWDLEHTKAVVHYAKLLSAEYNNDEVDEIVLTIAAYAHDWGYTDLYDMDEATLENIRDKKALHMERGAEKIKNLLANREELTDAQKVRIEHLVRVHDKVEDLEATDELVLMEADTLGALDLEFVTPTFNQEDNKKYLEKTRAKRFSRFITPLAKELFEELYQERLEFYNKGSKAD